MPTSETIDGKPTHVETEVLSEPLPQADSAYLVSLAAQYVPGSIEEKKLLRKLDMRILPCIWILFLMGFLDRSNIGNAKTAGLAEDFNLTSTQYSIVLLVFFVSYVLFEIPSNMLLARVRPSLYLSGLAIIWGAVAACLAACNNWQQLAAVRVILGIAESGFAPGVAFYLSSWYRRFELVRRFSIYYTSVAVAGAFSGLIAGVVTQHLDGARGIEGWRWLFIIEGVASCAVGMTVWFFMADWPSTTTWLSPEERLLAAQRLAYDGLGNTQGAHGKVDEWTALKMVVTDWRSWTLSLLYALVLGAQTIQYFVPTLINAFGWKKWEGQYHTIPPYACAFVFILAFSFASDYYKNKEHVITAVAAFGTICFVIVCASQHNMVRYVFSIFAVGTTFGLTPLVLTWTGNIIAAPAQKRAVAFGLVNAIGNTASIYGVFLWPSTDAPRYIAGFSATACFLGAVSIGAFIAGRFFKKYPIIAPDPDEVVAAEIRKQQSKGLKVADFVDEKV